MQRKVYILENLDCANCAAKIERKLSKLPELSDVSVTFATKQLRFAAEDPEAVLPKIRETIQSMEPDVEVVERTRSRRKAAETHNHEHHHHEHGEECGCAMTTTTMIMTTRNTSIITTIMNMEKSVDVAMTITIMSITIITITVRQNHRQLVHTHIFR